ncbi:hypothetical protein BC936DRAFT_140461 [Jimgerdemannia flammicorona]|uniref:Uncharacterized protein n=1 Tax=Jimgerdemannia flammicorona TaxID=994334 RepID=A0A433ATU6_9FUNG|nr:hypothetical protein BC936DRAFT_140461 [Jimgerdemannia flammicorona]
MVDLRANLHRLGKRRSTGGKNHELLHSQLVTSMGTTVDDVEGRNWENVRFLAAGKIRDMGIERNTLLGGPSLDHGERNTENCIGTQFVLIDSAIKIDQELVNCLLISHVEVGSDNCRGDMLVDILDGLQDA